MILSGEDADYNGDDDQFDTLERHRRTIALPDELPSIIHEIDGDEDDLEDYSYLWSNGETSSSIQINTIGEYSVEITDVRGCSITNFMRCF